MIIKKLTLFLSIYFLVNARMQGQTMDWISLPATTNGSVTSLTEYKGKLIVCGNFNKAGNLPANNIAAWDGANWSNLDEGIRGNNKLLYKTYEFGNLLYAVGNFDTAGTSVCHDIAEWDGTSWSNLGSGSDGVVYCMANYNNEIYAAGQFSTMGGVAVNNIARWNGSSWQSVNGGLKGTYVKDLCVFQNELYAFGNIDTINGLTPCHYMAKWNGSTWDTVPFGLHTLVLNHNVTNISMIEYNGKLLVGSYNEEYFVSTEKIRQWDGTAWSDFAVSPNLIIRKFLSATNGNLLCGGMNGVQQFNSSVSQWEIVGSYIIPSSIFGLCYYQNELYCSGTFNKTEGYYHDYIVKLADVTGLISSEKESLSLTVFPNPVKDELLYFKADVDLNTEFHLSILNVTGQIVYARNETSFSQEMNVSFLSPGIYYLELKAKRGKKVFKLVKG